MSVARNIRENPKLLPGGDATELTVSAALNQKCSSIEGIEKWPYGAAAIAFEAMPKTVAQNCGVNIQLAKGENAWIGTTVKLLILSFHVLYIALDVLLEFH
ncbi:hypothetical protein Peur_014548 [Populus x canadensis]